MKGLHLRKTCGNAGGLLHRTVPKVIPRDLKEGGEEEENGLLFSEGTRAEREVQAVQPLATSMAVGVEVHAHQPPVVHSARGHWKCEFTNGEHDIAGLNEK